MEEKKTEHLSTLGEKQSQHFAVLSYEGFYVLGPVSSIVNWWLSRLHPIQGSNWKMVSMGKKKFSYTMQIAYYATWKPSESNDIVYKCTTLLFGKYACWLIKGKRVKKLLFME